MSTPTNVNCPRCGNVLPARAPEGLCPRCLGALNLLDDTALTGTPAAAAQPPLTPAELAPHFPQLEILECLGRGGMGVVYKARQKTLNRLVALKLLAPERVTDPGFAERFTREAQALARLSHPNIVTIHDFGTTRAGDFQSPPAAPSMSAPGDSPPTSPPQTLGPRHQTPFYFLLMEFVDGVNLRQAMKAGRFTPEQALAVVPPVCEALQYAHDHGIVHRDIKPENLLLDKNGRVKIADFGIAKLVARHSDVESAVPRAGDLQSPPAASDATDGDCKSPAPTLASVAGTPQYMAPEQKAHRVTDHRADIYSLGVVLYELLTGEMPADKLQPPSRKVQIDVRLDEIVLRALETKPELRFQTAGEFRTQLVTFEREDRAKKREDREERIEKSNQPPSLSSILSPLSSPQPLLKTANAYLSTPEWLASARGRFWVYSGKGTLVLTRDQLAFTDEKTGATTSIPLAAIRDVSLGNYPWLAKPAPLHYLSVTWVENGLTRCRYFTPNRGWFMPVWETNPVVLEWHQALRAAVTAAAGKAPAETPAPPHRPTMPDLVWMGLLFGLPMCLIGAVLLSLGRMSGNPEALWQSGRFRAAIVMGFFALGLPWLMQFLIWLIGKTGGTPSAGESAKRIKPAVFLTLLVALNGAIVWGIVTAARLLTDFFANPSLAQRPGMDPAFTTKLANFLADHPGIVTFVAIFVCLVVDGLIIRRMRRAMLAPSADSGVSVPPASRAADVGQVHTPGTQPTTKSVLLFSVSALLGALIWLLSPLVTGHREPWDADSPYYWAALVLAGFVLACFDAKRPWLYALGVWIGQVVAFLFLVLTSDQPGGLWPVGLVMLSFYSLLGLLGALLGAGAHRMLAKNINTPGSHSAMAPTPRSGCLRALAIVGFAALAVFAFFLGVYGLSRRPTTIVSASYTPVRLEKNMVILDFRAVVSRGSCETMMTLGGSGWSATGATAASRPNDLFDGTVVITPDHPKRMLPLKAGLNEWRAAFVLPDESLAKAAWENLHPLGPIQVRLGRQTGGILFSEKLPNGELYEASFLAGPVGSASNVEASLNAAAGSDQPGLSGKPGNADDSAPRKSASKASSITPADPNWVSVSSAMSTPEASTLSSYNESGGVIMNWEVLASQPGPVFLRREGGQSTASLKRDPKTKLYQTTVSLELTGVGTDRVLLVSRIGGVTAREELPGNLRELSAELWSYKNLSATSARGTEIELCRFQGKPITVQVPVLTTTVTTPATVYSVIGPWVIGLCVIGGIVLVVVLWRKGGTAGKVVALLFILPLLLLIFVLVGYLSMQAGRATDAEQKAMAAAKAVLSRSATPTPGPFPSALRISRDNRSLFVVRDQAETALHYVFYFAGNFGTSSSFTHNAPANTWTDEGSVNLKNGRTFGFRREALYPDELHVNGRAYDLRKGRVLVLREDGTVEQRELFPPLAVARDPAALARLLEPASPKEPEQLDRLYRQLRPGGEAAADAPSADARSSSAAPPDALFSVEQPVVVGGDMMVRVRLLMADKDGKKQPLDEEIIFKTAKDRATGFVLRWHAYGDKNPQHANDVIVHLVDPDTGVILHRMEGGFGSGLRLTSPDNLPLPAKNKSHLLARPGVHTSFHLIRAETPAAPGAPITDWRDLHAEVTLINRAKERPVPAFQMPTLAPKTAPRP